MSPLDCETPSALFGEAIRDRRALRRAYARLVKVHSPEEDPDVFEHIRRLYERALAGLARPAEVPVDLPPRSVAPPEPAPAAFDASAWVRELDAGAWSAAMRVLEQAIQQHGEAEAARFWLACQLGRAPLETPGHLLRLLELGCPGSLIVELAEAVLAALPDVARTSAWDQVLARPLELPLAFRLGMALIEARMGLDDPRGVAGVWLALSPRLQHHPGPWRAMLERVVQGGALALPGTEVAHLLELLSTTSLGEGLPETGPVYAWLYAAQELDERRGELAPPLVAALEALQGSTRCEALAVLRELGAAELPEAAFEALAWRAPTLAAVLVEAEARASGAGLPPEAGKPWPASWEEQIHRDPVGREEERAVRRHRHLREGRHVLGALLGVLALGAVSAWLGARLGLGLLQGALVGQLAGGLLGWVLGGALLTDDQLPAPPAPRARDVLQGLAGLLRSGPPARREAELSRHRWRGARDLYALAGVVLGAVVPLELWLLQPELDDPWWEYLGGSVLVTVIGSICVAGCGTWLGFELYSSSEAAAAQRALFLAGREPRQRVFSGAMRRLGLFRSDLLALFSARTEAEADTVRLGLLEALSVDTWLGLRSLGPAHVRVLRWRSRELDPELDPDEWKDATA